MSFKALYNVPYHTVKHRKQHTAQGDISVLFEVQRFRISKRRWVTFSPTLVTGVLSQKNNIFLLASERVSIIGGKTISSKLFLHCASFPLLYLKGSSIEKIIVFHLEKLSIL